MSEMVLHRLFSMFPSVRPAQGRPERHHLLPFSPRLNKKKTLKKICVLSMALSPTTFFGASDEAFPSLKKKIIRKCVVLSKMPFEKCDTYLSGTTINTR